MKRLYRLTILIVTLFVSISETITYFNTSNSFVSIFTTRNYVFKVNANGGYFDHQDVSVKDNTTVLPTPSRKGYTFLGFSESEIGNINYSINISDANAIHNKDLFAQWEIVTYNIDYNLNGGILSEKKNNYTVEDSFTLPIPTRVGYTFEGWTGTDLIFPVKTVEIKNSIGDKEYTANWSINTYYIDVNPILDGIKSFIGYSGYTFDVYVDGVLVADDVMDWGSNIEYGHVVRVITNEKIGHTSNFDQTITVGIESNEITPVWVRNLYSGHFYYINPSGEGVFWQATNNLYGDFISTPIVDNVSQFGYDDNFYKFVDFTAWTTWYQPDYIVGFTLNIIERTCRATFGVMPNETNANAQQTRFHNAGYSYCNVNPLNTCEVVCDGTYSQVLSAYNGAWNGILPTSGSGFSSYRDMMCDSGWTTYSNR